MDSVWQRAWRIIRHKLSIGATPLACPQQPDARPDSLPRLTLGLWFLLAVLPFAGSCFYLCAPVVSSRYLMDRGPAFAAASWKGSKRDCVKEVLI